MGNIENEKDKLDFGIEFGMPMRHLIGQWAIRFIDQVLRGHIWAGNTNCTTSLFTYLSQVGKS